MKLIIKSEILDKLLLLLLLFSFLFNLPLYQSYSRLGRIPGAEPFGIAVEGLCRLDVLRVRHPTASKHWRT